MSEQPIPMTAAFYRWVRGEGVTTPAELLPHEREAIAVVENAKQWTQTIQRAVERQRAALARIEALSGPRGEWWRRCEASAGGLYTRSKGVQRGEAGASKRSPPPTTWEESIEVWKRRVRYSQQRRLRDEWQRTISNGIRNLRRREQVRARERQAEAEGNHDATTV